MVTIPRLLLCITLFAQPLSAAPAVDALRVELFDGQLDSILPADGPIRVQTAARSAEGIDRIDVTLTNEGDDPAWLEVRAAGRFDGAPGDDWMLYDGQALDRPVRGVHDEQTTFWPGIAMADASRGAWVGVDPHDIHSLIRYRFDRESGEYHVGPRIVLDPGHAQTVRFIVVPFDMRYAHRSALDAYYRAFPDLFRPAEGIDDRLLRGGSGLSMTWRHASTRGDQSSCEIPRRCAVTWDWMYGPYRIQGDPVMRRERWDLIDPERRGPWAASWGQIEAFRQARHDYFRTTDITYGVAPAFYTLNWVHEDLARTRYRDALMTEDMGWEQREGSRPGWVAIRGYGKAGPWWSVQVFPWGTSVARDWQEDYRDLVDSDLSFSAFAFDSNVCGGKYRGERVNELPARAWDDKGVFVSEGVGQALMADFLHGLTKDGRRIGVLSNHAPTHYAVAFRVDASILELHAGTVVHPSGLIIEREYARAQSGHKPRNLYSGYSNSTSLLRHFEGWQEMRGDQIADVMRSIHDRLLVFCLAYGWNLHPDAVMGDARMLRYAPVVADLVHRGWQPIPALRAEGAEGLFLSRFGDGDRMFLAVGNNGAEGFEGDLMIDTEALGGRAAIVTDYWGQAATVTHEGPGGTILVRVPPRDVLVLRAVAWARGLSSFDATARRDGDAHAGSTVIDLRVHAAEAGPATLHVVLPADGVATGAKLGGEPVPHAQDGHTASITVSVVPGEHQLVVDHVSRDVLAPTSDLHAFPFIDSNVDVAQCRIVIAEDADEHERACAFRLAEYFRYWTALMRSGEVDIPIVGPDEAGDWPTVCIGRACGEEPPVGLSIDRGHMHLRGRDTAHTVALLERLLRILDTRYPLVGEFQNQINYPKRPLVAGHVPDAWREAHPWIGDDPAAAYERIARKGGFWARALRTDDRPAGVAEPSGVLEPGAPADPRAFASEPAQ